MTEYAGDVFGDIIAYEQGELSDDETRTLFHYLVETGLVFKLQGHYGRVAHMMGLI